MVDNLTDCYNLSFPYCCVALDYQFEMGPNNPVSVFQLVNEGLMLIGLVYILYKLIKRQLFSVYFRMFVVFVGFGSLFIIITVSPLGLLSQSNDVANIVTYWTVFHLIDLLNLWFVMFTFQKDLHGRSVILTALVTMVIYMISLTVGVILWIKMEYLVADLFYNSYYTGIYAGIVLIPWSKVPFVRPRDSVYPVAIFAAIVFGLGVVSDALIYVNKSNQCTDAVTLIINSVFYPIVLYKAVDLDSNHWKKDFVLLSNEKDWLLGISTAINSGRSKIRDFPLIKWDDMTLHGLLGHGASANVYEGTWRGTKVAVKKLKVVGMDDEDKEKLLRDLLAESILLKSLRHPNIVLFLGLVVEPPHLALVTEFMSQGSLWDLLKKVRNHKEPAPDETTKSKILIDIATGINYLHQNDPPVLHRDLKSPNILIGSHFICKVADFGLSRKISTNPMTHVGTPHWAAPEVLRQDTYTEKADVYSFGVIIWEVYTYKFPHSDKAIYSIINSITSGETLDIPPEVPANLATLIEKCWLLDHKERPSFIDILDTLNSISKSHSSSILLDVVSGLKDDQTETSHM